MIRTNKKGKADTYSKYVYLGADYGLKMVFESLGGLSSERPRKCGLAVICRVKCAENGQD